MEVKVKLLGQTLKGRVIEKDGDHLTVRITKGRHKDRLVEVLQSEVTPTQ